MDRASVISVLEDTKRASERCLEFLTEDDASYYTFKERSEALDMAIAALREQEQSKAVQPIVEGASHDGEQDVAPVVRCKDCKHTRERNEYERAYLVEGVLICTSSDATDDCWNPVWPNHFCSYGERKEPKV